MKKINTILSAKWVLPIAPNNTILDHHSVVIDKDKIIDVLPTSKALDTYTADNCINLPEHALMPGMINMHTHTPMNLFRGLADDLALMDWLNHHIWPAEKKIINAKSVADGARLAIAEMLRGGTTCFNDHYFFHDTIRETAIECGMRANVGLLVMSVPTDWAQTEDEYFSKVLTTLERKDSNPLTHWVIAPHSPYTVSESSFRRIKEIAESFDLKIHIHLNETQAEIDMNLEKCGQRPMEWLDSMGLLSERMIAVHMVHTNNAEIDLTKERGMHVVHCPDSNMKLASGFAPIQKMLDKGINVSVATDGAASNNDLDLMQEMRSAAFLAKAVSGDPTALPAHQALEMATINGAKALGLDHLIGSLEKGKAADIIAIDLSSYLTQPVYNPISQIAYATNRLQVSDVWVAGKQLLKSGELTQLDTDSLLEKAHYWANEAREFSNCEQHEPA